MSESRLAVSLSERRIVRERELRAAMAVHPSSRSHDQAVAEFEQKAGRA